MADELEHKTITRAKFLSSRTLHEHTFPIFSTSPHIYEDFLRDTERLSSFLISTRIIANIGLTTK